MIVQIYEIQTPAEAVKCIALGVHRIGSVLMSKHGWKDHLLREVFQITRGTQTQNSLIPLFGEKDLVFRSIDFYRPHVIHFCETLTDDKGHVMDLTPFIQVQTEIKEKFPEVKIMRSIPIPEKIVFPVFPFLTIAQSLEPVSDIFLTDTWLGQEPVVGYIGITGKTVDPNGAATLVRQTQIPVILAGGLSPDNVYDALKMTRAAGADSCTQTNMKDKKGKPIRFRKDFKKVAQFVKEVKRAEYGQ